MIKLDADLHRYDLFFARIIQNRSKMASLLNRYRLLAGIVLGLFAQTPALAQQTGLKPGDTMVSRDSLDVALAGQPQWLERLGKVVKS